MQGVCRAAPASIDLGFALSVYGKDADGRFVAIQPADMPDAQWNLTPGLEPWPTEQ